MYSGKTPIRVRGKRSGIKLEKVQLRHTYAAGPGRVGEDGVDRSQAIMSDHADRFTI